MANGLKDGAHHNCKLCIIEESPTCHFCCRADNVLECVTLHKNGSIVQGKVIFKRVGMCGK
eukprot:5296335-Ditylum_brightwellii.AAC.1